MTATYTFNKKDFMAKLEKAEIEIDRAKCVAELISRAIANHKNHLESANGFCLWFPDLRKKYIHKADISRRAAERLRVYLNNLLIEIQL